MGMGTSKPGPAGSTPAGRGASLRSYYPQVSRLLLALVVCQALVELVAPTMAATRVIESCLIDDDRVIMAYNDTAHADCQSIATDACPTLSLLGRQHERVATVFTWTHGGKNVAVTGTWNNWQGVLPLNRSEHDFTAIIDLPPGVHQYKYIVDGKWTHAADQPVATDSRGNINNCMEIKEFRLGQSKSNALGRGSPPGSYTQEIPELIKFNDVFDEPQDLGTPGPGGQKKKPDEPPVLPPHLLGTRAVLNTTTDDPTVLPLPNHVMLNHLYFKKHEDDDKRDILILGTTQRYKEKFVTTVFYKAAPSLSDVNSGSTTTSPSVARNRPPAPLAGMSGPPSTAKPVARQLFSPRGGGSISDTIGSPRAPADDLYSNAAAAAGPTLTYHPTAALVMDRGNGATADSSTATGTTIAPTGTTSAMNILAKRRVSVSGDGAMLGRSPVQDEGPGTDLPYADYSLRNNMG